MTNAVVVIHFWLVGDSEELSFQLVTDSPLSAEDFIPIVTAMGIESNFTETQERCKLSGDALPQSENQSFPGADMMSSAVVGRSRRISIPHLILAISGMSMLITTMEVTIVNAALPSGTRLAPGLVE